MAGHGVYPPPPTLNILFDEVEENRKRKEREKEKKQGYLCFLLCGYL